MKPQHQIKFNRGSVEKLQKKVSKADVKLNESVNFDVVKADVKVGERELRFARALSDSEKTVRDASLQSLRTWLSENASRMSCDEMDRLWKGLFYCVWMADKRIVITWVIKNVVDLADVAGWSFLESLFACMMREWFGIDRYRIDKFYELISKAVTKCVLTFECASSHEEFKEGLQRFLEMLSDKVWMASRKCSVGVALHVLDVYINNIMRPALLSGKKLSFGAERMLTVFSILLDDLFTMTGARNGWPLSIHTRIVSRILERLVELVMDDSLQLSKATQRKMIERAAKRIFKIASDKKTCDSTRKRLYDLHVSFKTFVTEQCENKSTEVGDPKSEGNEVVPDGVNDSDTVVPAECDRDESGNYDKIDAENEIQANVSKGAEEKRKEAVEEAKREKGQIQGSILEKTRAENDEGIIGKVIANGKNAENVNIGGTSGTKRIARTRKASEDRGRGQKRARKSTTSKKSMK